MMKQFELEVVHPDGDIRFATVLDYQEIEAGHLELCGANETIAETNQIRILFNYPLTNSVTKTFQSQTGFTRRDLLRCIYEGYSEIYAAEPDPGYARGTANRRQSKGPYGIWGHYINDLVIEWVRQPKLGHFVLFIGS
jgi:hypothetical protein